MARYKVAGLEFQSKCDQSSGRELTRFLRNPRGQQLTESCGLLAGERQIFKLFTQNFEIEIRQISFCGVVGCIPLNPPRAGP
jgi:hypothetical protein